MLFFKQIRRVIKTMVKHVSAILFGAEIKDKLNREKEKIISILLSQ